MLALIRIPRVAKDLEVSERTVHSWLSAGILRCYRVRSLVFLDPQEVVEDIKAHSAAHPQPLSAEEKPEKDPAAG